MKFFTVALVSVLLLTACSKERQINDPGRLVQKTVDQDPAIPSISVNGTLLHAEAFGDPADPMVIFLHGGPGADYRNGLAVKQLVNDRYYVVFYDQRGSGLSKRHDKKTYTIDLMFEDLKAVIAHYRSSAAQKVFLIGHSWGGMLAGGFINKYPTAVNGAVFAEPGGFTYESLKEYGKKTRKTELFKEVSNDIFYLDQFLTGKENEHAILDYKLNVHSSFVYGSNNIEGIEGPSPYWRNGAVVLNSLVDISEKEGFDFTQNMHLYQPPVLFLYGENNKAYGLSFATKEAAKFTRKTLVEIKGTGHEMFYFKWPSVYPVVLAYFNALR